MTYPTIFHMGSGVRDLLDSVFDVWVISQNVQKLINLQFHDYFDANIFFPYKKTLVYSNHFFTQSLFAVPFFLVSKNPTFTYNMILLISFFTSALGMFLLARYLTGNPLASIIAGIIFAFSPFMISHLTQLQIITAGGIPLTFLFLHKFFKHEQTRHLMLFALFFILQFLASGHYALYLTLFCGLYMLIYMLTDNHYKQGQFWIKICLLFLIMIITLGPFLFQYIQVQKEIGFSRGGVTNATLVQFLASTPNNWIYGKLTRSFQQNEGILFPGILAVILAFIGFTSGIKKRLVNKKIFENHTLVYSAILLLSFLFTFGMKGPYLLLHKFVPGFNGVRVAQRFHVMVMFSLAVLAAFGIQYLLSALKKNKKFLVGIPLIAVVVFEYMSIPIPTKSVPTRDEIPAVYQWMETIDKDIAIIELPIPEKRLKRISVESLRMYYSIYHRKKMVNGRSSYFPPLYYEIRQRWWHSPQKQFINDLKVLGVRYMILHSNMIKKERLAEIRQTLSHLKKDIQFVNKIGTSIIYEILAVSQPPEKNIREFKFKKIYRKNWTAMSNINNEKTILALDGDTSTWWQSLHQKDGDYFIIDLNQSHPLKRLSLRLSPNLPCSYPLGYRVEVSGQGRQWTLVASSNRTRIPITEFLTPRRITLTIDLDPCRARYIKITNTGQYRKQIWTISEIEVFR